MISLKQYQQKAVEKLIAEINNLVEYQDNKVCVFKSPTGSGKTIMMAEFLQRFVKHRIDDKEFSFIWISVNQLHNQSRDKLDKYFSKSRILECVGFNDIQDRRLDQNEILFLNWQSINKKDNIYIRENEQNRNLSTVIEKTKENGREIILVIDESHHTAKSEKSKEVIEMIQPKVTIDMSATPQITGMSSIVNVEFQDVKDEGMIKTGISINSNIGDIKPKKDTDEFIIDVALEKRENLLRLYKKSNSNINPLVLIQLPDKRRGLMDRKDDIIAYLKKKHRITTDNRKLAIYLSDKDSKINLANIEKSDNETEVMIFKQAIALGWDCPRSSILVLFRDWKSFIFSIQTIGRIMRMPEFKHYDYEDLNQGYVFTNLLDISIAQDVAKDYITVFESKRDKSYSNIKLNSIYLKRHRERTRLSGQFSKILLESIEKKKIKKQITLSPKKKLVNELMVDGQIIKLDEAQVVRHEGRLKIKLSEKELQYRFDLYIRSICTPYAPADSSGRIKSALYKLFDRFFSIKDYSLIQELILSQDNNQHITNYINKAKENYKTQVVQEIQQKRKIVRSIWEVPLFTYHGNDSRLMSFSKSAMKPHYLRNISKPEQKFIELLEEKDNKVKWWYKNGESEAKYFAIKRVDESGIEKAFYVDFIVLMKDGSVGLFDTKGGFTAKGAKSRAEALAKYIRKENKNRKLNKLWGGIVVFEKDSCRLNDKEYYSFKENALDEDWKFLTFK